MRAAAILLGLATFADGVTIVPPSAADLDLTLTLRLVREQPLDAFPATGRVFRFLWLPPFQSQRIICVRVQDVGAGPELEAKAVWRDGRVDARAKRRLTDAEWSLLLSAREDGFWKYAPERWPQPVADGSDWILEGVAGGERLRLVQHVPKVGAFRSLCWSMVRLSGIKPSPREDSLREY
jgi:hypothetical protein